MPNLVGIGLSQVPTNSMLGGLAYQDPEHASIKNLDLKDLSQINSEISGTAVDVFVYDTRKDSDGGAWRKRTQHTSWYNETLNTSTRGSRKEFPAVAVIVVTAATTRKLYIYDGDDPDLPMWMVIDTIDGQWPQVESSSLHALNGIIALGSSSNSQPLYETRNRLDLYYFVSDKIESSGGAGGSYYGTVNGLVNRRSHAANLGSPSGNSVYPLVNIRVNNVAMTVLPNAPIDDTTGLPIPTIAVATDGGVSVIKDDGSVVDIRRTSDDDVHHVDFDGNRVIMFMELGAIYVATIPGADQSGNPNSAWTVYGSYGGNTSGTDHPAVQAYGAGVDLVSMKDHTFATAGFNDSNDLYKGLSILSENVNSSGNGMVAWILSDCNTGWMHGDIKGAFLSDTDTTNVSRSNLISNGTFDSNATGWSVLNGFSQSVSSSRLVVNRNGSSSDHGTETTITTVVGRQYMISVDVVSRQNGATAQISVGTSSDARNVLNFGTYNDDGTVVLDFIAASTTSYVTLGVDSTTNGIVTYDNVYVTEAELDRSVNNKGLQVFGTVTKSAVATGAELVAYGPFDNASYLRQPYNSDLQWDGNSIWSISFWVYFTQNQAYDTLISREQSDGSGNRWSIQTGNQNTITFKSQGSSRVQVPGDSVHSKWRHICFTQEGGLYRAYRDGVEVGTYVGSDNFSNTSAALNIGYETAVGGAEQSKLALVRISNSVPSPEQIKKMYEDEKHLFQENAKCTLYGSSDAVTALAYDEDTELLHVGTSAGRSDFQGLRRINNTTTAVTTAISASDDLIAEQ